MRRAWQIDDDSRTARRRVFDPRAAPVQSRQLAHDEQTDSTSRDRRIRVLLESIERGEDTLTFARWNPTSLVVDPNACALTMTRSTHNDRLRRRTVLHRVVEQIQNH